MTVNWLALAQVAGVTFGATVVLVALMAVAARLFAGSYEDDGSERALSASAERAAGIGIVIAMCLVVLFGIYLLVPYFHG